MRSYGHSHHQKVEKIEVETSNSDAIKINPYSRINKEYVANIKPIFQRSCFDCHSQSPTYPWYYKLPFVNTLIDNDRAEALKHLDLSGDFPFVGHGTPMEDLEAIADSVQKDEMPMFKYRVMHPSSTLSVSEKLQIQKWAKESLELLESK